MKTMVTGVGFLALCFFIGVSAHAFGTGALAAHIQEQQQTLHQTCWTRNCCSLKRTSSSTI